MNDEKATARGMAGFVAGHPAKTYSELRTQRIDELMRLPYELPPTPTTPPAAVDEAANLRLVIQSIHDLTGYGREVDVVVAVRNMKDRMVAAETQIAYLAAVIDREFGYKPDEDRHCVGAAVRIMRDGKVQAHNTLIDLKAIDRDELDRSYRAMEIKRDKLARELARLTPKPAKKAKKAKPRKARHVPAKV